MSSREELVIRVLEYATVLGLAGAGLFVRASGLAEYYFSPDDLLHLEIASGADLAQVWANSSAQMHPPLVFFILHYLMKISTDPGFLRFMPIVPGIAMILCVYMLGRRASGVAAGVAMGFVTAFGYAGIILSEVIRPYCLLVALLSLAFWFFLGYLQKRRTRQLVGYAALMSTATFLHYSAAIPFAAIASVWIVGSMLRKEGRREYLRALLANLMPAAILGSMYVFHVRHLSGLYAAIQLTYLNPHYIEDLESLWRNVHKCFGFLFLYEVAVICIILVLLGLVALWLSNRREVAAFVVVAFALTLTINLLKKYPFGGIRHSFYLLPIAALPIGAAVQYVADWLGRLPWVTKHRATVAAIGAGVVLLSIWPITSYYAKTDYLRAHADAGGYARFELPVRKRSYEQLMEILDENVGQNDVLLASRQASHYFRFGTRYDPSSLSRPSDQVMKIVFRGKQVYVVTEHLGLGAGRDLVRALRELNKIVDYEKIRLVWCTDIGWGGIGRLPGSDPIYARFLHRATAIPGVGATLVFPGRLIDDFVKAFEAKFR